MIQKPVSFVEKPCLYKTVPYKTVQYETVRKTVPINNCFNKLAGQELSLVQKA